MIASALCAALGWRHVRRREIETHRKWMLASASLGAAFFVSYVLQSLVIGDTTFGGPERWERPYLVFLWVHILLATAAGVLGIATLRLALRGRFPQHRRFGPWTASLWFVAAGTGLAVFLLLYVIFEPGPTVNIWRAVSPR